MKHFKRSLVVILLMLAVLLLAACGGSDESAKVEPALVEAIEGSEFNRVTLTERAAERLGIETAPVQADDDAQEAGEGIQWRVKQGQVADPGEGLVRVIVAKNMLSRLDREQPARIKLQEDDEEDEGFLAELEGGVEFGGHNSCWIKEGLVLEVEYQLSLVFARTICACPWHTISLRRRA